MVVASKNYSSGDRWQHRISFPCQRVVGSEAILDDAAGRGVMSLMSGFLGSIPSRPPKSKEPRRWATGLLPDQTLERETRESSPALYHIERVFGVSGAR